MTNRLEELLTQKRLEHLDDDSGVNRLFGLKDMIEQNLNKDSVVLEIGSFEGKSSEMFALLTKKVYCVDPWNLYDEIDNTEMIEAENNFDIVLKRNDNMIKIKDFSVDAAKKFEDKFFDCVYLDGRHEYTSVKEDIITWMPKIKDGGFISGHDYHWEDVRIAVKEMFKDLPLRPSSQNHPFYYEEMKPVDVYSDQSWILKIDDYRKYCKIDTDGVWIDYDFHISFTDKINITSKQNVQNLKINIKDFSGRMLYSSAAENVEKNIIYWYLPHENISEMDSVNVELYIDDKLILNKNIKKHIYQDIDGWFDFESIYTRMVENFPTNSHFVEIGSWMGKSTSYMAVEIANSNKNIKFDVIDTWEGSKGGSSDQTLHVDIIKNLKDSLYENFTHNVEKVKDYINPIQAWSFDVVNNYKDDSLDFVFIDGAHDYSSVKKDIEDWYPKIKSNGFIGGHDYNEHDWPGVVNAVNEFFGNNVEIIKNQTGSWLVDNKKITNDIKICLTSCCYNEEDIIPFYLDYYTNFVGVDKIILFDGGSTDNTLNIAKEYPNVEIIHQVVDKMDEIDLTNIRNNGWKKYKNIYDWFIVCDIDEFIYHPKLKEKLREYKKIGVTIPLIEGFDMISSQFPVFEKGNYIINIIKNGVKDAEYLNKKAVFDGNKVSINYALGTHNCNPTGDVIYSDSEDIKLLQYKWLSYNYVKNKSLKSSQRLSENNLVIGAGSHYKILSEKSISDFNYRTSCSTDVINNNFEFDCGNYVGDPEQLKISQLNLLEYFMKNENKIPFRSVYKSNENGFDINYEKIIELKNYSEKSNLLIPYLFSRGYEKISDTIYKKYKEKNIYIFSHNYLINNWIDIFKELMDNLLLYGLYKNSEKLFFCAYGDDIQWNIFQELIRSYDVDGKIITERFNDNFYEYHTLQKLWDFSQDIEESYIFYYHLKGVWSSNNLQTGDDDELNYSKNIKNSSAIIEWRKCLSYFNIEKWYNDVDKLKDEYDVVGALYNYNEECPLFTGNFWWANSNHVKKLERLKYNISEERYSAKLWCRIKCEKWINTIENKFYNFYNPKDLDLYHYEIDPKDYRDDNNPLISIITSSYKKYDELKNAINSVINQTYDNWEMLICSDGFDEKTEKIIKSFNRNNIKYYFTNETNDYGSTQKNYLTLISNGKYLIYLDDDNIIYPNCLETIINNFKPNMGMLICHIDYDGLDHRLPLKDEIILGKIDTLCLCVDKDYTKHAIWKNYAGQDYEFMKICENNILNHNKIVKFVPNIIGRHISKIEKKLKYSFITPTYKRYKTLKRCIDSVVRQEYDNWEMLICSDGKDDRVEKIVKNYNDVRIQYFYTEISNFFGNNQRNFMLNKIEGDYVLFLDDDNYIYENHLKIINDTIDNADMMIYRIDFENYEYSIIPIDNKIEHRKIDTLNFVVKKGFATKYKWRKIYESDYLYFKSIEADILDDDGLIKYLPDVLARHTDDKDIEKIEHGEIVIMTSHPNYSSIEDITKQSIQSFKDYGKEVILTSHTPLSIDLQKLTNHIVYDKNNPIIRHDYFTQSWFNAEQYYALIDLTKNDNNFNHALGVYLNYYNGIMYAKSLGYDTAICTNFDLIFVKDDIELIDNKMKDMYSKGKKSFYMNTPETDGEHFKTIFFITNIDYYLENFKYITNEQIYNDEIKKCGSETNCLENFVFHKLKNKKDDLLLQEIDENTLFSKSRINEFSLIEYQTILPLEGDPNSFVVWFSSSNKLDSRKLEIVIKNKGETVYKINDDITNDFRLYRKLNYKWGDNFEIQFKVTNEKNEVLKDKTLLVNDDIFRDIKNYGKFQIK